MRLIILTLLLAACSRQTSHIGNPVTLPVSGITTAISNAGYQARRNRVSAYLAANRVSIRSEARAKPGPAFAELARIARIPAAKVADVQREIAELQPVPEDEWVERSTIIAMVYSN